MSQEAQNIEIGGIVYPGDQVGTLNSVTSFSDSSPYAGVGFDFDLFNKVGLNLDLGILWQGEPDVTLEASGPLAGEPQFMEALERERQELAAEVEDYKVWPVVSLGWRAFLIFVASGQLDFAVSTGIECGLLEGR